MKTAVTFPILVLLALTSFAQAQSLNLKKIEAFAGTDAYTVLKQRFQNNDATLTSEDYQFLYYGQAFKRNTDTISSAIEKDLNQYFEKAGDSVDFEKVLQFSLAILAINPLDFDQLYITSVSYDRISRPELGALYFNKYEKLISTIMSTGDGKKEKTAFVVVSVADEYVILREMKLKVKSQALVNKKGKFYDAMSVADNKRGIEKVYFDINLFFGKWF